MNLGSMMGKGMTYLMLNCDKATYLLSKQEVEKLKCTERMKLRVHLMSCIYCRKFAEQSKYITQQLQNFSKVNPENLQLKLSEIQKSNLKQAVEKQLSAK